MKLEPADIKKILLSITDNDVYLNSLYFDCFMVEYNEEIKFRLLELWDAYLQEAKKDNTPISLN